MEYNKDWAMTKENLLPVKIKAQQAVLNTEHLLEEKPACVSFHNDRSALFGQEGAYVVLDFGKELCGSVRMITGSMDSIAQFRITLGESLTEACSTVGEKNATNDHSPRDFQVMVTGLSDLSFGMSGFRFAKIELLTEKPVYIRNIYAVNTLPVFAREGTVETDDAQLNRIIDTAAYTLKLNLQNGYIWDGIKRDRLVWAGDLHQEILLSMYLYGDNGNVQNSLKFLKEETPADKWINGIPSYSAWWVINLCDYYRLSGNCNFFKKHQDYAKAVIQNMNGCIADNGEMDFSSAPHFMSYFLDWPTAHTPDAKTGTAALIIYMAKKYLQLEENSCCRQIIKKLHWYLDADCQFKQTRAFQILAGRRAEGESAFLEKNGAEGFSTFMAYYILKADAMAGGTQMLPIIKQYFGGMLSRGATTFWEDFDIQWLEGSGSIDEFPQPGQKDIHGDYGAFCYEGFRHSLCHGWSSGVLAFIIEHIMGWTPEQSAEPGSITPRMLGVERIDATLPVQDGWLTIRMDNGTARIKKTDYQCMHSETNTREDIHYEKIGNQ